MPINQSKYIFVTRSTYYCEKMFTWDTEAQISSIQFSHVGIAKIGPRKNCDGYDNTKQYVKISSTLILQGNE